MNCISFGILSAFNLFIVVLYIACFQKVSSSKFKKAGLHKIYYGKWMSNIFSSFPLVIFQVEMVFFGSNIILQKETIL